jgi:PAS domain S-box-containing protein
VLDLNSLFSQSPDIGFITDRTGAIQAFTAGAVKALGVPGSELLGRSLSELDDSGRIGKFFTESGKGESRMRLQFNLRTRTGRTLSMDSLASCLRDPEGQPAGWFFAGQDLRGAVAEARGTRTILDHLIDSIGAVLWSFDRQGTVITWSRACESVFGIPREEAEGKLSTAALFGDPPSYGQALAAVDRSGQYSGELELVTSPGTRRPFHVSMTRLLGGESGAIGYSCVALDIAERKRVEEFQRVLFERAGEAILVVDPPSQRILDVNQKACEIHGYTREEMLSLKVPDLLPPDLPPSVAEAANRALAESGRFESERHVHCRKGGVSFPCAINIRRFAIGGRAFCICVVRDLTDQAKAEEFFRALFQKSNDGLILVEAKGLGVVEANEEVCRLLGYTREELLGLTLSGLIGPDPPLGREGPLEEGPREAHSRARRQFLRKDQTRIPTDLTLSRLEFAGGTYLLAAVRDITETLKVEEALRESAERFRGLFDATFEGIAVHENGILVDVNEAYASMLGYTREELIGKKISDHLAAECLEDMQRQMKSRSEKPLEVTAIRRDGSRIRVEGRARSIVYRGRPMRLGAVRDVTEARRISGQLEEAKAFLEHIQESANDGFVLLDDRGVYVAVNRKLLEMRGLKREDFIGRSFMEDASPERLESFRTYYARLMKGESVRMRTQMQSAEGQEKTVDVSSAPLERGGRKYVFAIVRDVTDQVRAEEELKRAHEDLEKRVADRTAELSAEVAQRRRAEDALRESEERYRTISESGPLPLCIARVSDGQIVYANPACQVLLGLPPEALVGRAAGDFYFDPEDRPWLLERFRHEGSVRHHELRVRRADGTARWVNLSIQPITFKGEPAMLGTFFDIHERRRAEEALRESEERFRGAFDHAGIGMCLSFPDGRFLKVNRSFCEMVGYSDSELLETTFEAITHPEDRQESARIASSLVRGDHATAHFQKRYLHRDGHVVWAFLSTHLLRDAQGLPLYFVTQIQDVTKRREAEEALRLAHDELERRVAERTAELAQTNRLLQSEIEERKRAVESLLLYEEIFARASEGVLILDPQGRMLQQNEAHRKLLGYSDEEIVGKTPELWATSFPENRRAMEQHGIFQGEVASRAKWGQEIIVELSAFPTRDPAGRTTGIVAIKRDITERKWAERAFRFILEGTSSHTGERFYRSLVRHLASALQVRFSLLSQASDLPPTRVRTLAFWAGNDFGQNFEKRLRGSPCEGVLAGTDCCYPRDLGRLFPQDPVLAELGAQSYMGVPLQDARGRTVGHLAVLHDRPIEDTGRKMAILKIFASRAGAELERQKTEEALRHSEERWRSLATHVPDFVLTINRRLEIEFINRTVAGGRIEDVLGKSVLGFVPEEFQDRVRKAIESVFEMGKPTAYEVPSVADNGGIAWYSTRVGPILHEGKVVGASLIATDITERRSVDEALRYQKTLLESQSEAAIDGILVVSREGKMVSFNRRFIEMWDIPESALQSQSESGALGSVLGQVEDPEAFQARLRHLYEHPDEESRDELTLLDGRTFDRYSAPVRSREGVLYGRVWYFRDVTGRKRTEIELRRAAEETRRAYEDLKQAQAQLIRSEKLASIGMLVSGVAHELNNPLNVMYGNLQLLGQVFEGRPKSGTGVPGRKVPASRALKIRRMIRDALKAAEHARGVVEDFRSFARDVRTAEAVDLNQCLEETVSLMKRELHPRVRVVKNLRPLPSVRCFRGQMNQVFLNLLKNASEAIEKKGTITLRTHRKDGRIVVEVEDTGRGMAEDVRRKLFEPFFTTKPVGKGLGLGLSISAMIVHNHGGRISVRSRPGHGSVFRVEIPVRS